MLDLDALRREAESDRGDRTVVSRGWLRQAHAELAAGRAAQAQLERSGQCFGLRGRNL